MRLGMWWSQRRSNNVRGIGRRAARDLRRARHAGASQRAEREHADAHLVALCLGLRFGQAHTADLGFGVGASRHVIVVDRLHVMAADPLREHDAFHRQRYDHKGKYFSGTVAEPGFVSVMPGIGEIMICPVSVCHHVSTIGQRLPPITV